MFFWHIISSSGKQATIFTWQIVLVFFLVTHPVTSVFDHLIFYFLWTVTFVWLRNLNYFTGIWNHLVCQLKKKIYTNQMRNSGEDWYLPVPQLKNGKLILFLVFLCSFLLPFAPPLMGHYWNYYSSQIRCRWFFTASGRRNQLIKFERIIFFLDFNCVEIWN